MNIADRKSLRLWPGVAAAALLCFVRFVLPGAGLIDGAIGIIGGLVCALAILVWWLCFSRAPWVERIGAVLLMIVALFATRLVADVSIRTGMRGMMLPLYGLPVLCVALVVAVAAAHRASDGKRRFSIALALLLACGLFSLLRTDGIKGSGSELAWRWTATAEQRLIAQAAAPLPPANAATTSAPHEPLTVAAAAASATASPAPPSIVAAPAEWPGFRGPQRDSVVRNVRINTDWSASPPVQLWRRPIGPGWSSFAVRGDLLYTQEQRAEDEIVSCYKVSTGQPVWSHRDPVRFWESNAGAGPRATPTLSGDRLFAFGATGILNALDAGTGKLLWSRNVAASADRSVPEWGFAGSPLIVDDLVIVAASGTAAAFDIATGKPRWVGPRFRSSYSSPHLATVNGVAQVLLLSASGAAALAPESGAVLWKHDWEEGGSTMVQPALLPEGGILINAVALAGGAGIRRLGVTRESGGWSIQERWTSNGLKPYFNDFVIHKGHAYGFDGNILSSIDLEDGKRKWKGGRYGNGQLILLADQDVLLVLSEDGELALVAATTDAFKEVARFPALNSKTWNHPVLVRDTLLVRNGEEMAAFRLATAK